MEPDWRDLTWLVDSEGSEREPQESWAIMEEKKKRWRGKKSVQIALDQSRHIVRHIT